MTNNHPTEFNKELLNDLIQAVNEIEEYIQSRPIIYGAQEVITQLVPLRLFKNNQAYYLNCYWVIVPDEYLPNKNNLYVLKNEDVLPINLYRFKD